MAEMTNETVNIEELQPANGSHKEREEGVCLLEAVAWVAGEPHSDRPACVDAVLASYGRALNDRMPEAERQQLKPYITRLIGTAWASRELTVARAMLCADRAVRVFAVAALRSAGMTEWADRLAHLDPVTDSKCAEAAYEAADAADAAYAAYAAEAAEAARAAVSWVEALRLLDDLIEMAPAASVEEATP